MILLIFKAIPYKLYLGMDLATWDIRIADDSLMENSEKFQIYLEEPINAVLGRKIKMNIHLINTENGNFLI